MGSACPAAWETAPQALSLNCPLSLSSPGFSQASHLGWGGATGMAGSEVGGTEHRGAGCATGTGCDLSAAAAGADAPTLERAACRPAAITVIAREPAGDHAAHASRLARR